MRYLDYRCSIANQSHKASKIHGLLHGHGRDHDYSLDRNPYPTYYYELSEVLGQTLHQWSPEVKGETLRVVGRLIGKSCYRFSLVYIGFPIALCECKDFKINIIVL